jgi:hypothetical protein
MKNVVNKTFKMLGRVYDSFMPSEDMARKVGADFIDRYGFKSDKKAS